MTGEIALAKLIKQMKPELQSGTYIFCTINNHPSIQLQDAIMMFKEKEGITMVISKEVADKHNIPYSFVTAWITLTVHSSLEAIGLTAAFSKALADAAISCNVVAGYFHDHIFVNQDKAELAMATLKKLSETA